MPIQHGTELNPFVPPKDQQGPNYPGNPGSTDVNKIPYYATEPPNVPKDYHAGPVGPPVVPWWSQSASPEQYRRLNEDVLSSAQGATQPQIPPDNSEQVSRSRPKQPTATRIQRAPSPGRSDLLRHSFWDRSRWTLTGEHQSMAQAVRRYPVRGMTTVAETRRNTFRLPPPTNDEVRPSANVPPAAPQDILGLIHNTNRGSWRLT